MPSIPDRKRIAAHAAALTAGAVISGPAAYAFAAIGNRHLGADGFAPVSVLWSFWAVLGAAVTFPMQHWVIHRIQADDEETAIKQALPRLASLTLAASLLAACIGWIWRIDLFRMDGFRFPILLGFIPLGAFLMGLERGALASRGRFVAVAFHFASENVLRLALAAIAVLLGWGAQSFGVILVAGYLAGVLWPSAIRFKTESNRAPARGQIRDLLTIVFGSVLGQAVLTGGPIAAAAIGAAGSEVTAVFATLALFRAPYVMFTAVASRLTGELTRLAASGGSEQLRKFRVVLLLGIVVAGAFAVIFAVTVGPAVVESLFGPGTGLPIRPTAIVAVGSVLALGTLLLTIMMVSRARPRVIGSVWLFALASGIAWLVGGAGNPVDRVTWAFLISETTAFIAMFIVEARSNPRTHLVEPLPTLGTG